MLASRRTTDFKDKHRNMRIALIGQSAFGKSALESLVERQEHQVVGVFATPDSSRSREPLALSAEDLSIPVWQFKRMRDRECIDIFQSLNADLCIMAYVTDIVPSDIIHAATLGTIQYHPSLLPLHRGPSSINWAVIQGDTQTGLSIFWPDEGLDTGPILLQKRIKIGEDDTVGSLYFRKLFPMGIEAILESVDLIADGNAPRIVQDESVATYEGWCGLDDARINWTGDIQIIHNIIRGCDPQPGAWSMLKEEKVTFYGSTISTRDQPSAEPGTILDIHDTGISIATNGGVLEIKRVRHERGAKIPANEIEASTGDRFV